ncbi:MAG: hypothetical protein ACHQY2_02355 [Candidatus Eremiobacterales bacterium]|jgi:K+ transporter
MGLSQRIDRSTLALYVLGIYGLVVSAFGGTAGRIAFLFGSGMVTFGQQIEAVAPSPMATELKYGAVFMFFALSYAVHRRMRWAAVLAIAFVAFDGAFLYVFAGDVGSGMWWSLELPFHALTCWWTFDALLAMLEWRTNQDVVRSIDVELELKHRLEDTDAPAPQAATFEARYRPLPPGAI